MMCLISLSYLLICSSAVYGSIYDIRQEYYPLDMWWRCSGVPNLQNQKVNFIEVAAKKYYTARVSGRSRVDRLLGKHMPPASILTNKRWIDVMLEVINLPLTSLGSYFYMKVNCDIFNDNDFVTKDYDRDLSRNTDGVRGIMDVVYRMGLCIRGHEKNLNCPDPCREKGHKFCDKAVNSIGVCGLFVPEELKGYTPDKDEELQGLFTSKEPEKKIPETFRRWYSMIPNQNRLPLSLFETFLGSKKYFNNLFDAQIAALKVPFCICEAFYTYDQVQETCIEELGDFACGGGNPCMNGGECQKAMQSAPGEPDGDDSLGDEEQALFVCKCPPAFTGELCENDFDPCAAGVGIKTCQPFKCVRVPEDRYNGFQCKCPPKTHTPKNPTEPMCVPIPACKSGSLKKGPCKAGGQCIQLPTGDPLDYECRCPPGYSGRNCETPPPDAYWAEWSQWGLCQWPRPAEACFRRAHQECTRQCVVHAPGQVCQGPSRRIRYRVCDVNSDDEAVVKSLQPGQRESLQRAFDLCSMNSPAISARPLAESELHEPMRDLGALDDWSNAGPEEGTFIVIPPKFRYLNKSALEQVNWPEITDLLYLTGWIYACILSVLIVLFWIYILRRWILCYYRVKV